MNKLIVKGLEPVSMIDWPGKITSVLFLPNCNFRCHYCYNPELVYNSGQLKEISLSEIINHLKRKKKWLDGVVLSGGEPTLFSLISFCQEVKKLKLLISLQTNGSNPALLQSLLSRNLIDHIAMDIKAPLNKYSKVVNQKIDLADIDRSTQIIRSSGLPYEFRTTVLPKLIKKEDIRQIGLWLSGSEIFAIQQCRVKKTLNKKYQKQKTYLSRELEELKKEALPYFKKVIVRS